MQNTVKVKTFTRNRLGSDKRVCFRNSGENPMISGSIKNWISMLNDHFFVAVSYLYLHLEFPLHKLQHTFYNLLVIVSLERVC